MRMSALGGISEVRFRFVRAGFDPNETFARLPDLRLLLIPGILAVVCQQKSGGGRFASPNGSACSLLTIAKMVISFG